MEEEQTISGAIDGLQSRLEHAAGVSDHISELVEAIQVPNGVSEEDEEEQIIAVEGVEQIDDLIPETARPRDVVTSRFSGAGWFESIQNLRVLLVGAGGIGNLN